MKKTSGRKLFMCENHCADLRTGACKNAKIAFEQRISGLGRKNVRTDDKFPLSPVHSRPYVTNGKFLMLGWVNHPAIAAVNPRISPVRSHRRIALSAVTFGCFAKRKERKLCLDSGIARSCSCDALSVAKFEGKAHHGKTDSFVSILAKTVALFLL